MAQMLPAGTPVYWRGAPYTEVGLEGEATVLPGDVGRIVDHLPPHDPVVTFPAVGSFVCRIDEVTTDRPDEPNRA